MAVRTKGQGFFRHIPLGGIIILAGAALTLWVLGAPSLNLETLVTISALTAAGFYGAAGAAVVIAIYMVPSAILLGLSGAPMREWGVLLAVVAAMSSGAYIVQSLTLHVWRRVRTAHGRQLLLRRDLRSMRRLMESSAGIAATTGSSREVLDSALCHVLKLPYAVGAAWVINGEKEESGTCGHWPIQGMEYLRREDHAHLTQMFYNAPLSFLVVAIGAGDTHDGALGVAIRGPKRRYRNAMRTLEYIAASVATALSKSRALDMQHKQTVYLKMFNEFGRRFAVNLSLEDLFDAMYGETGRVMDAGAFFVALYHAEQQEVELRFAYDDGERLPPVTFALNDGPTSRAILTRAPVLHNNFTRVPGAQTFGNSERVAKSVLIVPILLQDEVIGAISAQSYQADAFTQEHVELLTTIATQAAIALDNAQLYERTLQMAMTDSMTGLANARSFHESTTRLVAQAAEQPTSVSLLMIDSDSLKQINDRFGHLAGDDYLRTLSETIRDNVRAGDIVARYGGDEFAVLLPSTGPEEGRAIALRVLQAIRQLEYRVGVAMIKTTASAGIASYPQDTDSAEGLLRAADATLYRAKQTGKDRVCCFGDDTGHAVGG